MYSRKSIIFLSILMIVAISACNLPGGTPQGTPTPDLALTITALASGGGQSGSGDSSQSSTDPQETSTPEFTATPGPTSTSSVTQVSVSTNTNCRTGPGLVYPQVDSLLIGQVAEVVGKNSSVANYWVIKRINGSGTCWLWGEYATITGSTANLPEYPVPATPTPTYTPTATSTATYTPTPSIPAPVNNPTFSMVCIGAGPYQHSGTLNWEDQSGNETGFNIYINGALVTSVPANTTTYNVAAYGSFAAGIASIFEVEAYNAAGKAAKKSVSKACP
jgi:hypothetical protein